MHYRERKKVIKNIEFFLPRKKAILMIKRELGYTTIESREFYDKAVAGEFVGELYDDVEHILYLNTFTKVLKIEWEEEPLSKEELEQQEKLKAAEAWRDSLSPEDKAHHDLLIDSVPRLIACAG